MFCALNGATRTPSCARMRQSPVTSVLLPAVEAVPWIMRVRAVTHLTPCPPSREEGGTRARRFELHAQVLRSTVAIRGGWRRGCGVGGRRRGNRGRGGRARANVAAQRGGRPHR